MAFLKKFKEKSNRLSRVLLNDFIYSLVLQKDAKYDKSLKFFEWTESDWIAIMVEDFVLKDRLLDSYFIKRLNGVFNTDRFELLLQRWIVDYYFNLIAILDDKTNNPTSKKTLILEDNPLNRQGVKQYQNYFGSLPTIKWLKQGNMLRRVLSIIVHLAYIIYFSLKKGIKFSRKRDKFIVMREALWGLGDTRGYYFHDDFLVDGDKIKPKDLLLFSREISWEGSRVKARLDAKRSNYAHFDIKRQHLSIKAFIFRILPKYIFGGLTALMFELKSSNFSLFSNIFDFFVHYALPYEKIFSHYEITSELGHNFFSASHIVESIICQNYGTKYYLMHSTDNARTVYKHLTVFLSCDKFLIWGKSHIQNKDSKRGIYEPTGYVFKKFINKIRFNRNLILDKMRINKNSKIVSFFDQSLTYDGDICKAAEERFVNFWEIILKFAERHKEYTIIIKPKEIAGYEGLSGSLYQRFINAKRQIELNKNVYIVDPLRWSFIETIGVSDIVITQDIASPTTIAIICGIEGLYFDQAKWYTHPLKIFENKLIFDDADRLFSMIDAIINGKESPLNDIPRDLIRQLDEFPDDRGIDLFRDILVKSRG